MDVNKNKLLLSGTKNSFKLSSTHGTKYDKYYKRKYAELWDSVWKRDKNSCYYCGFTAAQHQEIHHLNGNHDQNDLENLVTVCPLCHQSHHLDIVSTTTGGKIIWLPELTQQELNYLSRALFLAIDASEDTNENTKDLGFVKIARMLENVLLERTLVVEQRFQSGASNPMMLASILMNMDEEKYKKRENFLSPFKLLNARSRFVVQTKYWRKNTYSDIDIQKWESLIKKSEEKNDD